MINTQVGGLLGLIILFFDIWAIIRVVQSSASVGIKALWIIIILFMPVLGLILWFLLGPKS